MDENRKPTINQIVIDIIENGRAANNTELENEFEFSASEAGYIEDEIKEALKSPWFPWFK